ncbi:isopentenyl-diphosphate Delta-isomerase [Kineosporia sp. R_H_3]|uniref:isopentenyl-diphosphate Delta-isomerase n=1 Tax=Kineosporia sp. R_H_3 TaxID=1961848 RepID=UPI0018E9A88C|nr:isopentenyl-diphosphate Delta-isomerase [Kineosporia sp. R_H_3]
MTMDLDAQDAPPRSDLELVVLLDDDGRPCGTALKADVHTRTTPLHLAFSCWVVDPAGRVLLTRRAESKRTWPGIWTNAFCGHPGPGEPPEAALGRRARQELGTRVTGVRVVLPDFRYEATMADGTRENEVCPVFLAGLADDHLDPDPDEVAEWRWTTVDDLVADVAAGAGTYSPWALLQLGQLIDAGCLARPGSAPLS